VRALIVTADLFEDSELLKPWHRLAEAGCEVDVAAPERGPIRGKHGATAEAGLALHEVNPEDYALLVLPGGKAPDRLRHQAPALAIARAFFRAGKPVAAICHGPLILLSAGLLRGRHATCYRTVAAELLREGVLYEDREVVVDGSLVTARQPSDLPAFLREMIALLA
jgi:protease I